MPALTMDTPHEPQIRSQIITDSHEVLEVLKLYFSLHMAVQKSILEDKTITQAKHQYSSTVVQQFQPDYIKQFTIFLKEIFASALFSVSRLDHNTRSCIPYPLQEVHWFLSFFCKPVQRRCRRQGKDAGFLQLWRKAY